MAMSKYQLAGSLEKKTLTLQEKIKFLGYAEAIEKLGCRKLADVFKIGKTAANNILKNKQILYEWYQKCCSSTFYPNGPLLKEEIMEIKNQLQNSDFDGFVDSDGWLKSGKQLMQLRRNES